jgi:hypothetical protein
MASKDYKNYCEDANYFAAQCGAMILCITV